MEVFGALLGIRMRAEAQGSYLGYTAKFFVVVAFWQDRHTAELKPLLSLIPLKEDLRKICWDGGDACWDMPVSADCQILQIYGKSFPHMQLVRQQTYHCCCFDLPLLHVKEQQSRDCRGMSTHSDSKYTCFRHDLMLLLLLYNL